MIKPTREQAVEWAIQSDMLSHGEVFRMEAVQAFAALAFAAGVELGQKDSGELQGLVDELFQNLTVSNTLVALMLYRVGGETAFTGDELGEVHGKSVMTTRHPGGDLFMRLIDASPARLQ